MERLKNSTKKAIQKTLKVIKLITAIIDLILKVLEYLWKVRVKPNLSTPYKIIIL